MQRHGSVGRLPGAAHLVLVAGVAHLDPASAVFEAMLEGWAVQQRTRFLKVHTVDGRLDLVRRFATFSNEYPWQWLPGEVEAFFDQLRSGARPIAVSTARSYQNVLRMFCNYVTDSRYGWPAVCVERLGWRRRRCCTSGTRSRMSASTRASRVGGR
jgi:integrase/recombinase XerD